MEVTDKNLAKVSRRCQLARHSRGFLSRLQIFKSMGPSLQTPSYDTKMLLKVVFDKTAFVKFKIRNYFTQNIYEILSKQPKIHTSLWILKISRKKSENQKSRDFCHMFVIFKQKTIHFGYRFKNLQKIYSLANGFLFFVISISERCESEEIRKFYQLFLPFSSLWM